MPLLWLAHNFCYRGKLDDLVNDVYAVSRDRYFIGETVAYQHSDSNHRQQGTIVAVNFDAAKALAMKKEKKEVSNEPTPKMKTSEHHSDDEAAAANTDTPASKKKAVIKPEEPDLPSPECYTYSFRDVGASEDDEDATITEIPHTALQRPRTVGSRVKMRLFMKKLTTLHGDRVIVTKKTIEKYNLANRRYAEFFAGPLPEFPKSERRRPGVVSERKNWNFIIILL